MFAFQILLSICSIISISHAYSPFSYGNASGLQWFKKAKLGMFIHYSPITQWGDELSWPLNCPQLPCKVQSVNHTEITINTIDELEQHRTAYYNLYKTFNPYLFNATEWMLLAKENGFKYVVYTAIHCAGFVSWNTSLTEYNIMNTPFGRDLYGELVIAARKLDLKIGAYFCPSLWLNNSYWAPNAFRALAHGCYPTYTPSTNQTTKLWWNTFINYIHSLSTEIYTKYAPDLYWYDCLNEPPMQDTFIDQLLPAIRSSNQDVLVMTRNGVFSDYVETGDKQEQTTLDIVGTSREFAGDYFEIPATMQTSGQWTYDPTSTQRNISSIIFDIILLTSKGGNYLLDISPMDDGTVNKDQINVLQEIGAWMNQNGEAIYDTMPLWPHQFNNNMFVTTSDNDNNHNIYILITGTNNNNQKVIYVPWIRQNLLNDKLTSIQILGYGNTNYAMNATGLYIDVPSVVKTKMNTPKELFSYAVVYKLFFA